MLSFHAHMTWGGHAPSSFYTLSDATLHFVLVFLTSVGLSFPYLSDCVNVTCGPC